MKCPFCKERNFSRLVWFYECNNNCGYFKSNLFHNKLKGYKYEFVMLDYDGSSNENYIQIMNVDLKNKKRKVIISKLSKNDLDKKNKYEIAGIKIDFSLGKDKLMEKIKKYLIYI